MMKNRKLIFFLLLSCSFVFNNAYSKDNLDTKKGIINNQDDSSFSQVQEVNQEKYAQLNFTLRKINLFGNKIIETKDLEAIYTPSYNKNIFLKDVEDILNKINKEYKKRGYLLAVSFPKEIDIKKGIVNILIVEAKLNNLVALDDELQKNPEFERVAKEVSELKDPLDKNTYNNKVKKLNKIKNYNIYTKIMPSKTPMGNSVLLDLFAVGERKDFEAKFAINNRLSDSLGPVKFDADFTFNNLLNKNESLFLKLNSSHQLSKFFNLTIGTNFPINDKLDLVSSFSSQKLTDLEITDLRQLNADLLNFGILKNLERKEQEFNIGLTYHYYEKNDDYLNLNLSYNFLDRADKYISVNKEAKQNNKLGKVAIGTEYFFVDSTKAKNYLTASLTMPNKLFGTKLDAISSAKYDSNGLIFDILAHRAQSLKDNFFLETSVSAQYSNSKVVPSEQFRYGGAIGKGFTHSSIGGDKGMAGIVKLSKAYNFQHKIYKQFVPYVFIDAGFAASNFKDVKSSYGSSAGGGFVLNTKDNIKFSYELARPILSHSKMPIDHKTRHFFGVDYNFYH